MFNQCSPSWLQQWLPLNKALLLIIFVSVEKLTFQGGRRANVNTGRCKKKMFPAMFLLLLDCLATTMALWFTVSSFDAWQSTEGRVTGRMLSKVTMHHRTQWHSYTNVATGSTHWTTFTPLTGSFVQWDEASSSSSRHISMLNGFFCKRRSCSQ